jgi:hypothetical protein
LYFLFAIYIIYWIFRYAEGGRTEAAQHVQQNARRRKQSQKQINQTAQIKLRKISNFADFGSKADYLQPTAMFGLQKQRQLH